MWKLKRAHKRRLEREKGVVIKDWGGKFSAGLVFPNKYYLGMSNLGFQRMYYLFNSLEFVVCERFFYPDPEELPWFNHKDVVLLSVESQRPARDFDILLFSVPFESDYTNVLQMLLWSKIPLHHKDRDYHHPIVSMGGVTAFLNPDVLANYMDFFFVGEGEKFWKSFWEFFRENVPTGERDKWLKNLALNVPGIYVPSLYEQLYHSDGTILAHRPVESGLPETIRAQKADISSLPVASTVVTTSDTEFSSTRLVEIGRGCGRGCRFCAAGYVYRPPRYYSSDQVLSACFSDSVSEVPRIGLVSAAVGDHPEIDLICNELMMRQYEVSFSSLRADNIKDSIVKLLVSGKHQAVAIAPEAGSDRLRRVVNKHLTDEQICEAAVKLTMAGIRHLKLYFMIGLPTETQDDIEAIVKLVKRVKHEVLKAAKGVGNLGEVIVSANTFVPKPFTAFQWVAFNDLKSLKNKIKFLRKALAKVSNVRFHSDLPKWSYVQALLSRGDRRVGAFVELVVVKKMSWQTAMKQTAVNPDFWVYRERNREEIFPWDIIDHGIKKSFLWEEYEKALQGVETPACHDITGCKRCGVCPSYPDLVYR